METTELPGGMDFFQPIVNNLLVGITIIDRNGYILFRNRKNEEISGIKNKDVIGKHFSVIQGKGELLEVLKTGIPKLGTLYETNIGTYAVIHRIPLYMGTEIIGAISILIFKDTKEIEEILEKCNFAKHKLELYEKYLRRLRSAKYSLDNIVGISDKVLYVKKLITKCVKINSPVLLTGETGTGKELYAHAIHMASERRGGPFVKVNCASIPRELFESELFGYDPGAFTNASKAGKIGKFELANYGSIFLDEISCLPIEMQPKLLRILQDKEMERVGGNEIIRLNFRLISATNRDLDGLMKENRFGNDLYYRIGVFNINLPSLRDLKEDIPCLCEYFVKLVNEEYSLNIVEIDKEVMDIFYQWHWPGNVRELRNVIERAAHLTETGVIKIKDLPDYLANNPKFMYDISGKNQSINILKEAKNGFERSLIESSLAESNWNKSRAASQLGISRPLLYALIKKYGLKGISRTE